MRRKAMLMGMMIVTGMPGWAVAKGTGKTVGESHSNPVDMETLETLDEAGADSRLAASGASDTQHASRTASEVLAQIRSVLRGVNYGVAMPPTREGWSMELLDSGASAYDKADPRLQNAKPVGLALRLKF